MGCRNDRRGRPDPVLNSLLRPAGSSPAPSTAADSVRPCGPGEGPRRRSRSRRGKEFPADAAPYRFLSPCPRRLTPPVPDAALPGPHPRLAVLSDVPGPMQSRLLLLGAPGGRGSPAARRVRLLLRQVFWGGPGSDARRSDVRLLHAGAGADKGNPGRPAALQSPRGPRSPLLAASLAPGAGSLEVKSLVSTSSLTAV